MPNLNDVYIHRRADTGAAFYVGIGKAGRAASKSGRTAHWRNIVAKHGLEIQYVSRAVDRDLAVEMEQFLISWIGRQLDGSGPLVNITDGGEGCPGRDKGKKLSAEHRAKLAKAKLGTKQSAETVAKRVAKSRGQKRTEDQRQKLKSIAATRSREHIEKIAASLRGNCYPEMSKAARLLNGKPLTCSNGMKFGCIAEAVAWLRLNGWPSAGVANVSSCCHGKRPTAYGHSWKFDSI